MAKQLPFNDKAIYGMGHVAGALRICIAFIYNTFRKSQQVYFALYKSRKQPFEATHSRNAPSFLTCEDYFRDCSLKGYESGASHCLNPGLLSVKLQAF